MSLQEALELIPQNTPQALSVALLKMLAIWDKNRTLALSEAIILLGRRLPITVPEKQDTKAKTSFWLEMAEKNDPLTWSYLADNLSGSGPQLEARWEKTREYPADPRILHAWLALIESPPVQGLGTIKFWQKIFELLASHRYPHTLSFCTRLLERGGGKVTGSMMSDFFKTQLRKVIRFQTVLLKDNPQSDPEEEKSIQQLVLAIKKLPKPTASVREDLFAAMLENPESDEAKLVFADFLTEQGDSRGEFIALQIRGGKDAEKQARKLLEKNKKEWLGGAAPALKTSETMWEQGFPVEGTLIENQGPIRRAIGSPDWWSFRKLTGAAPLELFTSAPFLSLRELSGISCETLIGLLKKGKIPLHTVRLGGWRSSLSDLKEAAAHPRLQTLRVLGLYTGFTHDAPAGHRWFWNTTLGRQIERIDGLSRMEEYDVWYEDLSGLPFDVGPSHIGLADNIDTTHITMSRTPQGWTRVAIALGERVMHQENLRIISFLRELPSNRLTEFSLSAPPKAWIPMFASVREAAERMLSRQSKLINLSFPKKD